MDENSPPSVAIIGASGTEGKIGHDILKNLVSEGFEGKIYPVNPKHSELLGKECFTSVQAIKNAVDIAVIVIPATAVPKALRECGEKGVRMAIVISAGFSEVHTAEGNALEEEIKAIAEQYTIDLLGPNCLGLLRPGIKMNASFAKELPPQGSISLVSQSGALAVALMDAAQKHGLGFSTVVSIGNKAVMNECDFLEFAENDDETTAVGLYLESIKDGSYFLRTAKRVAEKKPIVLLKSGGSDDGQKAASSHTGALAGSDSAITAACLQTGMLRAKDTEEFLDLLQVLSTQPPLLSENVAIVTNAGGPGVLATDVLATHNLQPSAFKPATIQTLQEHLPPAASAANPIDVLGDSDAKRYRVALDALGSDPNADGVVVIVTPQVMTPVDEIAKTIVEWNAAFPLMPVVTCVMGEKSIQNAVAILQEGNVPNFETPERAARALAALRKQQPRHLDTRYVTSGMRSAYAREILQTQGSIPALINSKISAGIPARRLLDIEHVQKIAELYSLPIPEARTASSAKEAVEIADELGHPVVMKVNTPDVLHKTDIGGVKMNLHSSDSIEEAFDELANCQKPIAKSPSVLVQRQLPPGHEFIVGMTRDPHFGPLVMVGLGGIYTELFADTAFRIAPFNEEEAYTMLTALESFPLLLGLRGDQQSDIDDLARVIATVSQLAYECPEIKEIDFNPVIVHSKDVMIADAKILLCNE